MKTIADLKASLPQIGTVGLISIRPQRRGEIEILNQVEVSVDSGIQGDHYSKEGGKRMVTLIQAEHIDTVSSMLNKEVDPRLLRRNIVVRGINLNALQDAKFKVGDSVILEGTGFCHPCSRMEENLGAGGYNVMRGHGGITAKVIQKGVIKTGDKVSFWEEEKL